MPLFVPSSIFFMLIFFEVICGWIFFIENNFMFKFKVVRQFGNNLLF